MKKLIFTVIISVLFLVGCQNEQTLLPQNDLTTETTQTQKSTTVFESSSAEKVKDINLKNEKPETVTLSKPNRDFIEKTLIKPLQLATSYVPTNKDMLSRCYTGYYYRLTANPTASDPFYKGKIEFSTGCGKSDELGDFRMNETFTTLEVFHPESKTYTAVEAWLEYFVQKKSA